jgi:L-iditol 2-dehydrogenase
MRAAVLEDVGIIAVREVPAPEAGPGEAVVKVAVAGICGSDLHGYASGMYEPGLIMGHEFSGVVSSVGPGVAGPKPGDRVTAHPILPCGVCPYCAEGRVNLCDAMGTVGITHPGAFAEWIALPAANFRPIGEMDFRRAAFTEPLSVVLHARRASGVAPSDRVLVVGGGTIGLLMADVLRLAGISRVALAEPNAFRRAVAERRGSASFDPLHEEAGRFCERHLGGAPTVVFECVGLPATIREAAQTVAKGGRVVVLGVATEPVEMDFLDAMYNEKSFQAVYSCTSEFDEALRLLKGGAFDPLGLATSEIPLSAIAEEGFGRLSGHHDEIKVLVHPD